MASKRRWGRHEPWASDRWENLPSTDAVVGDETHSACTAERLLRLCIFDNRCGSKSKS